ncbi:MAG: hypothetical protein EBS59_08005 [Verrucomicrobia bacterium]|nr:hypothetical protein [Verrucomicrobiota bacterium]
MANTVSDQVWTSLSGMTTSQPLFPLAQATLGASLFQTGFHNTSNNDLSKFSTGDYINPDTTSGQTLADFAKFSQAQTREAGTAGSSSGPPPPPPPLWAPRLRTSISTGKMNTCSTTLASLPSSNDPADA